MKFKIWTTVETEHSNIQFYNLRYDHSPLGCILLCQSSLAWVEELHIQNLENSTRVYNLRYGHSLITPETSIRSTLNQLHI